MLALRLSEQALLLSVRSPVLIGYSFVCLFVFMLPCLLVGFMFEVDSSRVELKSCLVALVQETMLCLKGKYGVQYQAGIQGCRPSV